MGSGVRAQRRRLELLWDSIEGRYGLLSEGEACVAAGTHSLQATGSLAVIRHGEPRYPGFQFTGGSIRTAWRDLTEPLLEAGWHPEDVLLWFAAPTGWLNGRTPADLIDEDLDAVRSAVTNAALGPAD